MKTLPLLLLAALLLSCTQREKPVVDAEKNLQTARLLADSIIANERNYYNYQVDFELESLLALFDATGDSVYLEHVRDNIETRHAPDHQQWHSLFTNIHYELYLRTGNRDHLTGLDSAAAILDTTIVRTDDGLIAYHGEKHRGSLLIDLIQGYTYLMASAGKKYDRSEWIAESVRQYQLYRDRMRNPENGLWHHATIVEDDGGVYLCPEGWCRGQAWVLRGMVNLMTLLDPGSDNYMQMETLLEELAQTLLQYQDEDGMWHQLMQKPGTYAETSGTGMISFWLLKALHNGFLEGAEYREAAIKASNALYAYISEDGVVSNSCRGTPPLRGYDAYRERPTASDHAYAPVIMALCAAVMW